MEALLLNKLEKHLKLYKQQYEDFMMQLYGSYKIDRASMDLDGMMFRIKYMMKHEKDLDKLPDLRKQFEEQALYSRNLFVDLVFNFIDKILGDSSKLKDIFVTDVKMDQNYVDFDLQIISKDLEYLEWIDSQIKDDEAYDIFPGKYFRFNTDSYNDGIAKAYPELFESREQNVVGVGDDKDVFVHSMTIQVGERCSLGCLYCYQFAKSEMKMSFDTAKEFIDHLLNDDYGYINRYNSPAIILEFIGGEPLLEIHLTRRIYEYFLERCYELNHPWFTMHRLSICSNGMQYFDEAVQEFFRDYFSQISFNISIDGNKELHDSCRVQPNGEGSYDIDMMALNHYNKYYTAERNSKMTLAPSNISYLYDSVVDFINHGMTVININCVFEEGWEPKHAAIEYDQLKQLANYILKNDLEHLFIAIFNERQEDKMDKYSDNGSCGGTGSMLSIRPNGDFYPCIRYMPSSVGTNRRDMNMGNVKTGMIGREDNSEVIKELDNVTRRGYTTDICWECPLSNECMCCAALSMTVYNSMNRRTTFACIMVIAEHLANVYYWNNMLIKHPEWDLKPRRIVVPDEWALLVISEDELDLLKKLEILAMMNYMEKQ